MPPTRRSRRPTASWHGSTTRTAIRATRRPRSASRRSPRPTTCSRDPEKRKAYDRPNPFGFGGGGPAGGGFDPGQFTGNFGDMLSNLFGNAGAAAAAAGRGDVRSGRPPQRGRDLETEVSLTFDQAVNGAQVPLAVPTSTPCPTCRGTGAKPGTTPEGLPGVRRPRRRGSEPGDLLDQPAVLQLPRLRHRDRGPVPDLRRQRRPAQHPQLRVNIPAGVHDGSRVRLAGKGEAGLRGGGGRATCT